jgi:para-aminobenzoate synthetase component 1
MSARKTYTFFVDHPGLFKQQWQEYMSTKDYVVALDSNEHTGPYHTYDFLGAAGGSRVLKVPVGNAFEQLDAWVQEEKDWMFGYLSYDLKNELEQLDSKSTNELEVSGLEFFIPESVWQLQQHQLSVLALHAGQNEVQQILDAIIATPVTTHDYPNQQASIHGLENRDSYIQHTQQFLKHIALGDMYEANYCTPFQANDVELHPLQCYKDLNAISTPPFAAYAKLGPLHVISASPERYLKKQGDKLITQPIKGTARRSHEVEEDNQLKSDLLADPKERSENVMIVDLVRNDLSRTAQKGTVQVEELFGIYSFKQVHQMISTVVSRMKSELSPVQALTTTFPMGSMTGAPKISAMKIIEQNEVFYRGVYSGAVGYFTPQGDFDFNVIIRTILYHEELKKLTFAVGSAITIAAQPEKEYDECLLKARALFEVLEKQGIHYADRPYES